ncbi:MAG: DUF362 domain-containing protein [Candidatus Lokiarchaeota archaeon]|nr:DUF362 domain-containing protein [Candidatus Lokiarchaeota archaeon]
MKSDVFYFTARTHFHGQSMSKFKGPLALKNLGIEQKIKNGDNVVIKTHFGALENNRYLRPSYIRFLCDFVEELGGIPSVAESCGWGVPESVSGAHTEYSGRASEEEYLKVALLHGFTKETMGAPILMLDGKIGTDIEIQKINGNIFKEVLVAGRLREFDYMIMASHFKGHAIAGFGGALKNLGIGCVSKGGKAEAHTGKTFEIDFDSCNPKCNNCINICPTNALTKEKDNKLNFNEDQCKFCYMCASVCRDKVFNLGNASGEDFITQFIDNAKGVVDFFGKDKIFYVNYAIDITYQCDCTGGSDVPFVPDIGVLASLDPVAVDQATIDLVHKSSISPHSALSDLEGVPTKGPHEWFSHTPRFNSENGEMDFSGKESKHWQLQLKLAEEIGLGKREYNLIEVEIESKK